MPLHRLRIPNGPGKPHFTHRTIGSYGIFIGPWQVTCVAIIRGYQGYDIPVGFDALFGWFEERWIVPVDGGGGGCGVHDGFVVVVGG